jgi:hypothetical protein
MHAIVAMGRDDLSIVDIVNAEPLIKVLHCTSFTLQAEAGTPLFLVCVQNYYGSQSFSGASGNRYKLVNIKHINLPSSPSFYLFVLYR